MKARRHIRDFLVDSRLKEMAEKLRGYYTEGRKEGK